MSEPATSANTPAAAESAPAAAAPAAPDSAEPRYRLRISKVTGTLLVATRKTQTYTGTFDELCAQYRRVRTHNLTLGWWGITAIVWNIMVLIRNRKAMAQLRALAAAHQPPPVPAA
jgi:hypothetical protein